MSAAMIDAGRASVCSRCGERYPASARHTCVRCCACCAKPLRGRSVEGWDGKRYCSYAHRYRAEDRQGRGA